MKRGTLTELQLGCVFMFFLWRCYYPPPPRKKPAPATQLRPRGSWAIRFRALKGASVPKHPFRYREPQPRVQLSEVQEGTGYRDTGFAGWRVSPSPQAEWDLARALACGGRGGGGVTKGVDKPLTYLTRFVGVAPPLSVFPYWHQPWHVGRMSAVAARPTTTSHSTPLESELPDGRSRMGLVS